MRMRSSVSCLMSSTGSVEVDGMGDRVTENPHEGVPDPAFQCSYAWAERTTTTVTDMHATGSSR